MARMAGHRQEGRDREMENRNGKKKWVVRLGVFMLAMLIMTFVSRIIYVDNMPRVHWSYPKAASIQKEFSAEGTVEAADARSIAGLEGLLVDRVDVAVGQQIEEGTLLYEVDVEDLEEQLGVLKEEERIWQEQVRAEKSRAAAETKRAREDYDDTLAELDRNIAEQNALLEDLKEDLELHLFRIPEEDAADEVWIAWADERTRLDREIEAKERDIEEAEYQKEETLKQAGRDIEDAQSGQQAAEGLYSAGYGAVGQIQERQRKIEVWEALAETDGRVYAAQAGTVIEVMLRSGMRMAEDAVIRYADAQSSLVYRTVVTQEQKALVHTGDSVRIRFPGSSQETTETVDSIVQEGGDYVVTVRLEPGAAQGQTEGVMSVSVTSQAYDFVIPRKALHSEGGICYIYVLEEKTGILGTELTARRQTVGLEEQNEDMAAISDSTLQSDMMIVTDSDKELENGIAVMEW